ncbi:MAG: phosphoribosylanthranilate isomerase [Deltaproteobacteria bacterium]|nr:phosphoribosylanthranilate isomerase [Deltaproteobacteria bacterium]
MEDVIQVAGVIDQAEADLLVKSGVHYLGFPLRLPVHQEDLSEREAAAVIRALQPPTRGVLITYLSRASDIAEFCAALGVSVVQLHGDVATSELRSLKEHHPQLTLIKSLVIGLHPVEQLLELVERTAPYVDAYITDTFDPTTGAAGATGKTHDWRVSKRFVQYASRPVILAGGLHPGNVRDAILEVQPAGVDAHTGLEDRTGRKSEEKVREFVSEAREAFRLIHGAVG